MLLSSGVDGMAYSSNGVDWMACSSQELKQMQMQLLNKLPGCRVTLDVGNNEDLR